MKGLVIENVYRRFGAIRAAEDVSLTVAPGELVCLLGPSGCGKSTTLRIAAGLDQPDQGRVLLNGKTVAGKGVFLPPEKRHVGFLFQDFALFPHLDVTGNIAFGLDALKNGEKKRRIAEVLEQVGMTGAAHCFPHTLSGGQQQRVALARALAPKPSLMLLDEPFSGLDSRLRDQVRDQTLHVLKNSGVATLMVTHDPEEAMFMADRIVLMRDGKVIQVGPPEELYFKPVDAFTARFFGEANRLEGVVKGGKVKTPLGDIPARDLEDGTVVEVLIRPEALELSAAKGAKAKAEVLAARMLGRTSLVHLCIGEARAKHLHLHARVPGRFLPREGEDLDIGLDLAQAFVFAV